MAAVALNKTLIIVIVAVSGLIVCIVILLLAFKRFHRSEPAPLPPIQPLAHEKERESGYLPYSYTTRESRGFDQLGLYGSEASLKPSRMPSFRTDESPGTLSSSHPSLPTSSSPPTNSIRWPGLLPVESHPYEWPQARQRTTSPPGPSRQLARANSLPSTRTSTHVSTRSVNTIYGTPHSRYNNFEIVLPTPLAPQLQDRMIANPSAIQRGGVVSDLWITAPNRTTSQRPNADQSFSDVSESLGRKSRPGPAGHQYHPSLFCHSTQPRPVSEALFLPHSHSTIGYDPQRRPPRTLTTEKEGIGPSVVQRPFRAHGPDRYPRLPPSNTPNIPLPRSASRSWHRPSPSLDGPPPPPVPLLPQVPQQNFRGPDAHHPANPTLRLPAGVLHEWPSSQPLGQRRIPTT